jgi:anaerobic magnesium-protoporphyrin IX monomethyl ester cyclase
MRIALIGAELEENLAVRYIWSSLEKAGHEVIPVIFNHEEDLERAACELARSGAEIAGFSMVFTYRAREFARLAVRARQFGFSGHLCAGGHFAALNAENLLREEAAFDSVACGEGEQIMLDLVSSLSNLSRVRGLVWRQPDGSMHRNEPATKPPDLDVLPPPVRKQPFDRFLGAPIVNILSSRGCTHHCAFCSIAAWHRVCGGERLRQRSIEQVADEMSELYSQGVRLYNFHDDNFFSSTKEESFARFRALRKELRRRRIGRIGFAVKARPDDVDEEIFRYLKEIGLFRVFLGVEAGTAESLKRLGRGQTLADNDRALDIVNGLNIHVCFNLLLFNPDSTLEDVDANVRFLRTQPRNPMNFCRTEIYSGTPLELKLRHEGRLLGSYWGFNYVIPDRRAQAVFELIHAAFSARSFGEISVHHTTMAVDYERQILDHFFGCSRSLTQRVRQYVVDANLNTCDYLAELIRTAEGGFATAHQRDIYLNELRRRLSDDNDYFQQKGAELLRMIRSESEEKCLRSSSSRIKKTAAAAAMLAAVTVTSWQTTGASQMMEMVGRPPVDRISPLHQEFKEQLLPLIVRRLDAPMKIEVVIITNPNMRSIGSCTGVAARGGPFNIAEAKGLLLKQPLLSGVEGDHFTEDEVAAALKAKGVIPSAESPKVADQRERSIVLKAISSIIQPQEIKIILSFGQAGVLVNADLSGVKASSEEKTKLLINLCDQFASGNQELAGKNVAFSFKDNEFPRRYQMFEMISLPPKR